MRAHGLRGRGRVRDVVDDHRRAPAAASRRAIARPMPREPPVTSATCPASGAAHAQQPPRARATPSQRRPTGMHRQRPGAMRFGRARSSTRPGPTSSASVGAERAQRRARSPPSAPARSPARTSSSRDVGGVARPAAPRRSSTTGSAGVANAHAGEDSAPAPSAAGAISAQWNGALTGEALRARAPRAARARRSRSTAPRARRPRPARRRSGSPAPAPRRRPPRRRAPSTSSASRPITAAIAPTPGGHRLLHEPTALAHAAHRVAERERARRDQRASTRPRLCPATADRREAASSPRARGTPRRWSRGSPAARARCSASVSSGPSKQSRESGDAEPLVGLLERAPRDRERRRPGRAPCRRAASPGPGNRQATAATRSVSASSTSTTLRPRYVPQCGQARCRSVALAALRAGDHVRRA